MSITSHSFHFTKSPRRCLAALSVFWLLVGAASPRVHAAGGAFNVFVPIRTSQGQITDLTTTLNFRDRAGNMMADSAVRIIAGVDGQLTITDGAVTDLMVVTEV